MSLKNLRTKYDEIKERVSTLIDMFLSFNPEIKQLTKELLHGYAIEINDMALFFQTLFPSSLPFYLFFIPVDFSLDH